MYQRKLKKLQISICLSCRKAFVSFRRNDPFCCDYCAKSYESGPYDLEFLEWRAAFIHSFEVEIFVEEVIGEVIEEVPKPKIYCPQCGRDVVIGIAGKFCSRRCANLFWEEHRRLTS